MESFEDDDDTHFCNKCHSTINGLGNYVRHRQSGCRSTEDDKGPVEVYHCPPATPNVTYPEILNADAFFSSLELQSSAKTGGSRRANELLDSRQPRRSGRVEELQRRKRKRKDKSPEDIKDEVGKTEKLPNLLPVVTDLDDLGIPSLVGFPDIVGSKPSASGKTGSKIDAASYSGAKQEGSQKRHAWLEDTMLTDLDNEPESSKEHRHQPLDRYEEYDYQQDDESDEVDSLADVDMAEEVDTYSDSEDSEQDPQYPPQSHTGGKWKPAGIVHEEVNEDDGGEIEEPEQQNKHPPPSYTGGKWKPTESSVQKCEEYESKETSSGQPPPSHTRGKWVPGARADIGVAGGSSSAGYWCSPCGRKLASRLVYNRHLLSDLHARRSIQEIDGALMHLPRAGGLLRRPILSRRQKALALKKQQQQEQQEQIEPSKPASSKQRRRREKEVLSCEMCRARVRRAQMGKHLLSHYHCRVAGARPSGPRARAFLLNNMANVVRQCPFQCAACKFYCNTEESFLRHWRSETHKDTVSKIDGSFVCGLCDFWCDDNESVEAHIMKQGHQDVVSMINGSVPMVIRRQRVLTCSTCCRRFRYNIQLRFHVKETGHRVDFSASDEYQSRLGCSVCGQVFRSPIALQRHQLACHKQTQQQQPRSQEESESVGKPYFCSFCSLSFGTSREAVLHRRTSQHKEQVRSKRSKAGTLRSCPHCEESQVNLTEHKQHLLDRHPELCHRCAKCGKQFALSQDVTCHTRDKHCTPLLTKKPEERKCPECPFTSESETELLFHQALHPGPQDRKYSCPLCERSLAKSALRDHLRKHTGERPFSCPKCSETFARRSAMKAHQKGCTGSRNGRRVERQRERKYVCDECNAAFHTKHILRQHMLRHAGKQFKCGLPGCPTVLRTETELKNHRKLVHETSSSVREFQCDECSYASKTKAQLVRHQKRHQKSDSEGSALVYSCHFAGCRFQTKASSHLKRHVRLHTGKKPYKCRHCSYASNNLENLRKHVLLTNLHAGKTIYQCESCETGEPFQTNFSKELRAHLLQFHASEYPTPSAASSYVTSIFGEPESKESRQKPNRK